MKTTTLKERIVTQWTDKDAVYARLQKARETIGDLFRPDLGVDYDEAHDMLMLGGDIYEGSGPWVARRASTAFQGNTVSKKLDWIKYGFSDDRLAGIDELDAFCQDSKKHISAALQHGNFYDTQPQFTLDGWTTGSPLTFIEEDPDTGFVMCLPVHWLTYRILYDRFNLSEGVIVQDEWTAKKCFDKFCPDGDIKTRLKKAEDIFSVSLFTAIRDDRVDERFVIWRGVFRSRNKVWGDLKLPVNKKWVDVYFEDLGLKENENKPLLKTGYYSKPFVHWDYDKKPWESASRTPAFEAVYDNLSLQQISKAYVENLQLKVRPAMAALLEHKSRLKLGSEGITYVDKGDWNYTPKPIEQVGDIRLDVETMQYIKEALSRHFHLDTFRMFSDLAQQSNTDFRVLQLVEMAGEKITQLLPTIESHEKYLSQVDERVRDIERQAGRGPFSRSNMENIYDILENYLGPDAQNVRLQPEFIGTLRQTQQMQQKLKPLTYGIKALAELANAMGDPNLVKFMIKGFDVGDETLRAVNFPQKLIRQGDDYLKLVEQDAQAQAQAQQFQKMIEMMKASKGVTNAVDPTSIAGQIAGAA